MVSNQHRLDHLRSRMHALLFAVLCLFVVGHAQAADVPPPRWDIVEVCQALEQEGGPCPRVESDTRRALLDRWTALPAENRIACTREVDVDGERSYRKLAACIDDLALKAFEAGTDGLDPASKSATQ